MKSTTIKQQKFQIEKIAVNNEFQVNCFFELKFPESDELLKHQTKLETNFRWKFFFFFSLICPRTFCVSDDKKKHLIKELNAK